MTPAAPELSVIIPAFNESARLGVSLGKVVTWLRDQGRSYEILVVDDGSSDGTAALAGTFRRLGVRTLSHRQNRGKGAAVRTGIEASLGRLILISDADLSTPIEDLERLEPSLAKAPIVVGSRAVPKSQISYAQPFLRARLGRLFNLLVQWTTLAGLGDTQCGFKLLEGNLGREIFAHMVTDGFAFDVEMLWLARQAGHAIEEVGVRWRDDRDSRVRPWLDGPAMLADIVKFRLAHLGNGNTLRVSAC